MQICEVLKIYEFVIDCQSKCLPTISGCYVVPGKYVLVTNHFHSPDGFFGELIEHVLDLQSVTCLLVIVP